MDPSHHHISTSATTIQTPQVKRHREDEWNQVLIGVPTFSLPTGPITPLYQTVDSTPECSSQSQTQTTSDAFQRTRLCPIRYIIDLFDEKWIGNYNAHPSVGHQTGGGKTGKTSESPEAPQQLVTSYALEDAFTMLELYNYYHSETSYETLQLEALVNRPENYHGVPSHRLEKLSNATLAAIGTYWVLKRKANGGGLRPLIPELALDVQEDINVGKSNQSPAYNDYNDPFAMRDWDCPVWVQLPLTSNQPPAGHSNHAHHDEKEESIVRGIILTAEITAEFKRRERLSCQASMHTVYTLALARRAAREQTMNKIPYMPYCGPRVPSLDEPWSGEGATRIGMSLLSAIRGVEDGEEENLGEE
eukprot:Tbor_TRINITY_DN3845_c0_g1::TRINITY_DN3845_c0_g1_i1::g.5656::m.5656